jgi:tRNA threonylcarbamoyladenosine modification (KEOPS) complex  Pcc1 subunit
LDRQALEAVKVVEVSEERSSVSVYSSVESDRGDSQRKRALLTIELNLGNDDTIALPHLQ